MQRSPLLSTSELKSYLRSHQTQWRPTPSCRFAYSWGGLRRAVIQQYELWKQPRVFHQYPHQVPFSDYLCVCKLHLIKIKSSEPSCSLLPNMKSAHGNNTTTHFCTNELLLQSFFHSLLCSIKDYKTLQRILETRITTAEADVQHITLLLDQSASSALMVFMYRTDWTLSVCSTYLTWQRKTVYLQTSVWSKPHHTDKLISARSVD